MSVALHENEDRRIAALRRYTAIGREPEKSFDDLTLLSARMLGAPIAALSFVGTERLWFKSVYGAQLPSLCREESFCAHAIDYPESPTVVFDAQREVRFRESTIVRGAPFVRAYAGIPLITPTLQAVGALCVMDTEPRDFSSEQMELLGTLARQAVSLLELRAQAMLLESVNEKLVALATCDSLTGLKNHRAFHEALEDELDFAARNQSPISVALIDIDDFKEYNDRYGHPAGDDVLKAISILLIECSREYDCIARYGGEEFAVVLRDADASQACTIAERLRKQIADANWPERRITVSVGIASMFRAAIAREALITAADARLYQAKRNGKNQVCCHDEVDVDPGVWDGPPLTRFKNGHARA